MMGGKVRRDRERFAFAHLTVGINKRLGWVASERRKDSLPRISGMAEDKRSKRIGNVGVFFDQFSRNVTTVFTGTVLEYVAGHDLATTSCISALI